METLLIISVFVSLVLSFSYGMYLGRIAERTDQRRRREWQHRLDQQH